jgi:hypothetical protein
MAIANFFHCKCIPDAVVESPRFLHLVRVCRLVGEDFVAPNGKRIGGDLLYLNYTHVYQKNKEELLKVAKVFGLTLKELLGCFFGIQMGKGSVPDA